MLESGPLGLPKGALAADRRVRAFIKRERTAEGLQIVGSIGVDSSKSEKFSLGQE